MSEEKRRHDIMVRGLNDELATSVNEMDEDHLTVMMIAVLWYRESAKARVGLGLDKRWRAPGEP